ncbi:phage tail protein [Dactylosporangium sp. NPDC051541]|uniref:phage tail protein n=1 Tax=Dactylosporangium sp. NPDC051541 TaxID=3363977 RepID=UPI003792563A
MAGRLPPISGNEALFNLVGTTYGSDGQSTFGVPHLRGRTPMHMDTGPGLTPRTIGQAGGAETVTLTVSGLPAHTHQPAAASGPAPPTARPAPSGPRCPTRPTRRVR